MPRSPIAHEGAPLVEVDGVLVPERFGDPVREAELGGSAAVLIDMSHHAVLRLDGKDVPRFCNSMLSNNIRDMQPGDGNYSVITDSKGRIMGALELLMLTRESVLLVLDGSDPEWASEHLDKYIIMDPIEISRLEGHVVLALQGPTAGEVLGAAGIPVPEGRVVAWGEGWVARSERSAAGGFELLVPVAEAQATWERLIAAGAGPAGFTAAEILRIRAGLPRWPVDMGERAFPHEMRLVQRACSFTKGCYIGQEVINRMETMGKVNKRLVGVEVPAGFGAGAEVRVGDQSVGVVGSAAGGVGLAVLRAAAWEPGTELTFVDGERQGAGRVRELPFTD